MHGEGYATNTELGGVPSAAGGKTSGANPARKAEDETLRRSFERSSMMWLHRTGEFGCKPSVWTPTIRTGGGPNSVVV